MSYLFRVLFAIKVDPLNLESQNQAKNIPVGLLRQIGAGFLGYDRTNKQTDKQRLQLLYT